MRTRTDFLYLYTVFNLAYMAYLAFLYFKFLYFLYFKSPAFLTWLTHPCQFIWSNGFLLFNGYRSVFFSQWKSSDKGQTLYNFSSWQLSLLTVVNWLLKFSLPSLHAVSTLGWIDPIDNVTVDVRMQRP